MMHLKIPHKNAVPRRLGLTQSRGVATLTVSFILLLIVTLSTLYANRALIFELKTAANHYRYTQALEVAEKGLEETLAWLQVRSAAFSADNSSCSATSPIPITRVVWGCKEGATVQQCADDPYEYFVQPSTAACNAGFPNAPGTPTTINLSDATLELEVNIRRRKGSIPDLYRFEIVSEARTPSLSGGAFDVFKSQAIVTQAVAIRPNTELVPADPGAPIVVAGGITAAGTGTVAICPSGVTKPLNANRQCNGGSGTPGNSITTLQPTTSGITSGMTDASVTNGGTVSALNTTATAFQVSFPGITTDQIKTISDYQRTTISTPKSRTVFYFNGAAGGYSSADISSLLNNGIGSASAPVVMVFDQGSYDPAQNNSCPGRDMKNGSFYGIFYFFATCDMQGAGNMELYGSLIVDGDIPKVASNAVFHFSDTGALLIENGDLPRGGIVKIPGSWRDF